MRPSKRTISTVSLQLNRRSGTNPLVWRRMTLQLVALPQAPRWALSPGPRSDHCRDMWEQVRLLAPVPVWSQVALLGREMLVPPADRCKHDMTPFMRSAWPPKATVLRDLGFIRRPITKVPDTINIAEWRRPAHRPFRGLLGVHSRFGLHTPVPHPNDHSRRVPVVRRMETKCSKTSQIPIPAAPRRDPAVDAGYRASATAIVAEPKL